MHETGYSLRLAQHNWHVIHGALVGGIDLSMTRRRRWYRKAVSPEEETNQSRVKKSLVS